MSDFTCREAFLKERLEIIHQQQLDFTDELISFNFPKMHLMQHYVDHVKQFGSINSFSTDAGEAAHIDHLKKEWAKSKNRRRKGLQSFFFRSRPQRFRSPGPESPKTL